MTECLPFIQNVTNNERVLSEKTKLTENETLAAISLSVMACFIVTANLALVVGLRKTNKRLTISQKLYFYLSITDSFVGIICLPFFVIVNSLNINTCRIQAIGLAISVYSFGISWGTFTVISVLCKIAIRKPLCYEK